MSHTISVAPMMERMTPPGRPKSNRPTKPPTIDPPMPTRIVIGMLIGFGPGMTRRPRAPMTRPLRTIQMMSRITVSPCYLATSLTRQRDRSRIRQVLGGYRLDLVGGLEAEDPTVEPQLGLYRPDDVLGPAEAV